MTTCGRCSPTRCGLQLFPIGVSALFLSYLSVFQLCTFITYRCFSSVPLLPIGVSALFLSYLSVFQLCTSLTCRCFSSVPLLPIGVSALHLSYLSVFQLCTSLTMLLPHLKLHSYLVSRHCPSSGAPKYNKVNTALQNWIYFHLKSIYINVLLIVLHFWTIWRRTKCNSWMVLAQFVYQGGTFHGIL